MTKTIMYNKSMERVLDEGTCIDVNIIGEPHPDFPGVFILDGFFEGMDYCDAEKEEWIRSIGQDVTDDKIYASVDYRFHQNPKFRCLWLR